MEIGRKITEQSKLRYVPIPIVSRTFYFSRLVPSLSALSTCKNLCSFFFFWRRRCGLFVVADCRVPTVANKTKQKKKHTKFGVRFYHAFRAVFIPGRRTTSLCLPDPSRPKCPAFFGCLRLFFAFQALWLKSGVGGSHRPQQTKPFSQCDQKPLDFFIRPSLA